MRAGGAHVSAAARSTPHGDALNPWHAVTVQSFRTSVRRSAAMTRNLILVLGDQLTHSLAALAAIDPARDQVLMAEVAGEARYVPHHRQKLAFVFAAMRHFAVELEVRGVVVRYVRLDAAGNSGSLDGEMRRAVAAFKPERIVLTEPGEWRVWQMMQDWRKTLGVPVEIRRDGRFLCSRDAFAAWTEGRRTLRMEFFYREMRRRTGLLMEGDEPAGGQWNFDHDNRKRLPRGLSPPPRRRFPPDATTWEVIALVADRFPDNFGDLEGFGWPVTRAQALQALDDFIVQALPWFGDYQDAMKQDEPFVFHALLSGALNAGLLDAMEICGAAESAWREGHAPLNAVEGFIRQIIGWREYVRGIYWTFMPDYASTNALSAARPLPDFYWSGETEMNCLRQTIADTRRHAYAHHIQRLMTTGNFALLAGLDPAAVEEWYLAVYVDAYEWVELPNTHGMALWADGGMLGSKPYAASGAYIDRMSDYCKGCAYDPAIKLGHGACPFNFLYWDFLARNRQKLRGNTRLAMPYRTLDAMPVAQRESIAAESRAFLEGLVAWRRAT